MSCAQLHDAELHSLRHDKGAGTVECVFRTAQGQDEVLLLGGVSLFRCTDFGLQNVVLELVGTPWQPVAPHALRSYVGWLSATCDGAQLTTPQEIDRTVQQVLQGRAHCVYPIPSWGAQLGAIATQARWLP